MKKAIICDDSRVSALALQYFLTNEGIFIEATVFGQKEFEEVLKTAEKPDFVTMDMVLPDGDGIQCCKKLWEKYPKTPVIFVTTAKVTEEQKAELPYVKDYFEKSIIPEKVKASLSKL
jgi:DNA-binding response OmpR family regulator